MCGITGYFNFNLNFTRDNFVKANNIIRHRGPDDFGYVTIDRNFEVNNWNDEHLSDYIHNDTIGVLGFRRLSILDLSRAGHQPMVDSSGKFWIIFNGEIYNYIELRDELVGRGYVFKSNTDTEVILNAYREWGVNCLERFNGMWAFAIFDAIKKKLFCSRDRLGIKPFYYIRKKDTFSFGSEIKQLLELFPNEYNHINDTVAFDFLALGSYGNESEETYFKDVFKLQPGHYIVLDLNEDDYSDISFVKWWDLPDNREEYSLKKNSPIDEIRFLFEDSIKLRLRSDVLTGTALSGGIDSSGIVSMISKITNGDKRLNETFTIFTKENENDDNYFAKELINALSLLNHSRIFEDTTNIYELERLVWHQDEPPQTSSIFGSWQLYKLINEHNVTVAFDGQGADELMGGYYQYPFRKYLLDIMKSNGLKYYFKEVKNISCTSTSSRSKIHLDVINSTFIEFYKLFKRRYYRKKLSFSKLWLNSEFFQNGFSKSKIVRGTYLEDGLEFNSILKKESYQLIKHTNLPGILRQVDRNSMAFSVEARLPFLDYRLVELLYSLPVTYMINEGFTKFAFRKAMNNIVPETILARKSKIGFKMPEFDLLKNNQDFIFDNINSLGMNEFIRVDAFNKYLSNCIQNTNEYNNIIWRVINFAIWKNTFKLS